MHFFFFPISNSVPWICKCICMVGFSGLCFKLMGVFDLGLVEEGVSLLGDKTMVLAVLINS